MTKHILFTPNATIYSKPVPDSTPWGDDILTVTEDATYPGVFPILTSAPYVFIQEGATPEPTDILLGNVLQFYYGSVTEADLYFQRRVHAWDWQNANLEDKLKALYTATHSIEIFNFVGEKVDEHQLLEFPRTRTDAGTVHEIGGTDGVPISIETACYLVADALIGGRDPQADFEAQNVKVETFGPTRTEFDTKVGPMQHISNMIPSPAAWALILPFLSISTSFSVNRG